MIGTDHLIATNAGIGEHISSRIGNLHGIGGVPRSVMRAFDGRGHELFKNSWRPEFTSALEQTDVTPAKATSATLSTDLIDITMA